MQIALRPPLIVFVVVVVVDSESLYSNHHDKCINIKLEYS